MECPKRLLFLYMLIQSTRIHKPITIGELNIQRKPEHKIKFRKVCTSHCLPKNNKQNHDFKFSFYLPGNFHPAMCYFLLAPLNLLTPDGPI